MQATVRRTSDANSRYITENKKLAKISAAKHAAYILLATLSILTTKLNVFSVLGYTQVFSLK